MKKKDAMGNKESDQIGEIDTMRWGKIYLGQHFSQ